MAGLVIEVWLGYESGPPTELGSFAWWDGLLILFLFMYWGVTYLGGRDGSNTIDLVVWRADVGRSRQR